MPTPLDHLAGPGKSLQLEPPDEKETVADALGVPSDEAQ